MGKLLIGTGNKTRLEYVNGILKDLSLEIVGLNELEIHTRVEENGSTPLENSLMKANGYYEISKLPTLSIDAGLYIDKFPESKQPGLHVKRIGVDKEEVSDDVMLDYYISELNKYGGESDGHWEIAISLVLSPTDIFTTIYKRKTKFTTAKSESYSENEPLNTIQIDTKTGKYVSDLSVDEKMDAQADLVNHIYEFVKNHYYGKTTPVESRKAESN